MKTKLKQNGGFAIVSVVFLLFVLSLMGTAMYMYSVTSLRSVRFLSDRKKAEYLADAKAVTDGKVITARGMGCAAEFGREIVTALVNEETAGKVLEAIQYK